MMFKPILDCEAFNEKKDIEQFKKVHSNGYFKEYECEADLSADTLSIDCDPDKNKTSFFLHAYLNSAVDILGIKSRMGSFLIKNGLQN